MDDLTVAEGTVIGRKSSGRSRLGRQVEGICKSAARPEQPTEEALNG